MKISDVQSTRIDTSIGDVTALLFTELNGNQYLGLDINGQEFFYPNSDYSDYIAAVSTPSFGRWIYHEWAGRSNYEKGFPDIDVT